MFKKLASNEEISFRQNVPNVASTIENRKRRGGSIEYSASNTVRNTVISLTTDFLHQIQKTQIIVNLLE